jgi:hypothetical protein
MKNKKILLSGTILFVAAALSYCNNPERKIENKKENVVEANKELDEANAEYLEDMALFKKESADKIAANEKSISDFKARIAVQKQAAKSDYTQRILELERKNGDFKKKLEDYKETNKEKWNEFKAEFNRDMIELNDAIRDFTTDKK